MKLPSSPRTARVIVFVGPIIGGVVLISLMALAASFGGFWAGIGVGVVFVVAIYAWVKKTQADIARRQADAAQGRLR